uniref:Retinoic acid induced 2 n=1 Tax=Tetraodon nigroviridis TaxID=99883 RepID=H3BW96_TETNG
PAPSGVSHAAESPGAVALKVATTVLHPVCLGESPLMLPIHLQMSGAAAPQLGQMGAAPYLITSPSPVSLPLVLDQQVIQHMSPSVIPPPPTCPPLPLQNNVLCQNPLSFGLPPAADPKSAGQTQDTNLLSLLQNPAFAAIMHDLFPSQAGSSACPSPAQPEDTKGNVSKPVCTVSKSTQTSTSPSLLPSFQPQNVSSSSLNPDEGQALDLSVRACPLELKQEYPAPQQDNVLDLSVPGVRKHVAFPSGQNTGGTPLSLGVECTQSLDSKVLGSLASLEFSRKHKWVVDGNAGGSASRSQETSLGGSGNLEIVSTSQTAKVIVSVKDGIPAILCGKIKGISGVSTKNFSIKRDGGQGSSLQQLYGAPSGSHPDQSNPSHVLKKVPKSRAIKLKNISSQEIHFLPVKKQRLAALLPRK